MLLLLPSAFAAPFFGAPGPETAIEVDRSGTWPRAVPTDDGWSFFFASGGDYWFAPLDDTLAADLSRTRPLTGRDDLVDHGIARCPDGSFLHAASYTVNAADDSVVVYAYDADLEREEETTLVEGRPEVITRDMPVVCGDRFQGLGYFDTTAGTTFAAVRAGESAGETVLDDAPMMTGSGWADEGGSLWTVGHGVGEWGAVRVRGYDDAFELHTAADLALVDAPLEAYWSQGLLRIGEHSVIAFMARDEAEGWQLQDGDVWLAVLDADWNVVETLRVTTNTPPVGAMQPGLTRKGDTLLVTYVRDLQPYAVAVPFDAGAFEATEEPIGVAGCARGGAAALLLPLAARRRRRAGADR